MKRLLITIGAAALLAGATAAPAFAERDRGGGHARSERGDRGGDHRRGDQGRGDQGRGDQNRGDQGKRDGGGQREWRGGVRDGGGTPRVERHDRDGDRLRGGPNEGWRQGFNNDDRRNRGGDDRWRNNDGDRQRAEAERRARDNDNRWRENDGKRGRRDNDWKDRNGDYREGWREGRQYQNRHDDRGWDGRHWDRDRVRHINYGGYFNYRHAPSFRSYYGHDYVWYGARRWNNWHRPWRVGYAMPRYVYYQPVSYGWLPPCPYGYSYVRVDRDVLLISLATGLIIDAMLYSY